MPSRIGELGELQLAVLHILWERQPVTVHEAVNTFPPERKPAYTTVLTVLRNLEKRGLVAHDAQDGARMFRYRALVTLEETRQDALREMLTRLFDGSPALLLSALLELDSLSPADARDLCQKLEAQKEKSSAKTAS